MANSTPERVDTERLLADPRLIDELNQNVIKEFRSNQGNVGGPMEGMPVLLLTMTGAKSGRTLVRPLCYGRDGDRIVIIASYGGAPGNPPWYYNLVANPLVTVEAGVEKFRARAEQVYGTERERLFDGMAELMPVFRDYQNKTKRELPVLTLTRID